MYIIPIIQYNVCNFAPVKVAAKSKDFCSLSRDQISRLISSDKLLVSSEGEVYKAVVRTKKLIFTEFLSSDLSGELGGSRPTRPCQHPSCSSPARPLPSDVHGRGGAELALSPRQEEQESRHCS